MEPSQLIHYVQKWRLSFRVLGNYDGRKIKFHIPNGFRPFSPYLVVHVFRPTDLQTYRLKRSVSIHFAWCFMKLAMPARQSYVALHPLSTYIGIFTGVHWCQIINPYSVRTPKVLLLCQFRWSNRPYRKIKSVSQSIHIRASRLWSHITPSVDL